MVPLKKTCHLNTKLLWLNALGAKFQHGTGGIGTISVCNFLTDAIPPVKNMKAMKRQVVTLLLSASNRCLCVINYSRVILY